MASIVVLGGGFGGITAALELRAALGDAHRITLVERKADFMMGLRKLWILVGAGTRAEGSRDLAALRNFGIDVRRSAIEAIDLKARTAAGIAYDYLVVALGAEPRPDLVKGWSDAAHNLYDVDDVERLASRPLAGRIAVVICGVPYKCPPAPYEAAMLLADRWPGSRVSVYSPQPMSLPVAGKAACVSLEAELAKRRIPFTPGCKLVALDGPTAVFENGRAEADVLVAVPPHRPPAPLEDWMRVDPATMRTPHERVWAVGDCVELKTANGLPFPKAGILAEGQARVAAAAVAAEILGRPAPAPFDGRGYCFVETGGGLASMVVGEFLAQPAPKVELAPPSAEGLERKRAFERERLAAWFGA